MSTCCLNLNLVLGLIDWFFNFLHFIFIKNLALNFGLHTASTVIQWNSTTTSTVIQYHYLLKFYNSILWIQRVHRVNGHSTANMKPNWSRSPCWQMYALPQVHEWWRKNDSKKIAVHRVNGHSTASTKPNWSRSPCWQMHALPEVNVWWNMKD